MIFVVVPRITRVGLPILRVDARQSAQQQLQLLVVEHAHQTLRKHLVEALHACVGEVGSGECRQQRLLHAAFNTYAHAQADYAHALRETAPVAV